MKHFIPTLILLAFALPAPGQAPPPATAHHEANFDAEHQQGIDLYTAGKILESLPLYEDLCRQDPTVAVFAERHAAGLLAKEATLSDPAARTALHTQAIKEIQRAQALGDTSDYARNVLGSDSKTFIGSMVTGIPLSIGYTYQGNAAAKPIFQEAEATFAHSDVSGALQLYIQAAALDPTWYNPTLCAGDMYARLKDPTNAALWYAKAIAIDPDRETAYRWWGDALFYSGDQAGAGKKYAEAVVAEPYGKTALGQFASWAKINHHELVRPDITRPEFITPQGVLKIDPILSDPGPIADGRSAWIVYQQYRVAHGARVLNQFIVAGARDSSGVYTNVDGYRHTIAEEHAALRAMLADLDTQLKTGAVLESNLNPTLRNIRSLEKAGFLGAWIAIDAADAGIRSDYPDYRAKHRQHLVEYVDAYLIR